MSIGSKVAHIAGSILLFLVMSDVVGVVASFFFDVAPARNKSGALFYAIWFVLGVFAGMTGYNAAASRASEPAPGDWSSRPDAERTGRLVISVATVIVAMIGAACYFLMWKGGGEASYFVPDSPSLTVTFFVAFLGSAIIGHAAFRPKPEGGSS